MTTLRTLFFSTSIFALLLPVSALAQSGPLVDAANEFESTTVGGVEGILLGIAQWFLVFLGIIAIIMALVAAYKFITAGDNEDQVQKARQTLVWALVGVAVAIISFSIVTLVESALTGPTTGGSGSIEIIEPFI